MLLANNSFHKDRKEGRKLEKISRVRLRERNERNERVRERMRERENEREREKMKGGKDAKEREQRHMHQNFNKSLKQNK